MWLYHVLVVSYRGQEGNTLLMINPCVAFGYSYFPPKRENVFFTFVLFRSPNGLPGLRTSEERHSRFSGTDLTSGTFLPHRLLFDSDGLDKERENRETEIHDSAQDTPRQCFLVINCA